MSCHRVRPVERQKVSSPFDRDRPGSWDQIVIVLALGGPGPIPIAPHQQNRHIDAVVVLGSRLPASGVSQQADEGPIMPTAIAHDIHVLHELAWDAFWVRDAASKHRLHDDEVPEPVHGLAEHWNEGRVRNDPAKQGATRHPSSLRIVVGIYGDDARNARVLLGGNDERDCAADRNASESDLPQVLFFEEAFDRFDEESGVIANFWNVGIAVSRIVQSIDGEVLRKLRHDLFEQIELRPERVEQHEDRTCSGLDVAELVAVDLNIMDRNFRRPTQRRWSFWNWS